jgi:hypothetical protein
MKRMLTIGMIVTGALSIAAQEATAQNFNPGFGMGNVSADPFSGYYSWFLPRQAAMAATPTVNNQLSQYTAERIDSMNESARSSNSVLSYANLGLNGNQSQFDDDRPRNPRPRLSATGPMITNTNGRGLSGYHDRAGSYYPTMRQSTYRNPGLPASRGRR